MSLRFFGLLAASLVLGGSSAVACAAGGDTRGGSGAGGAGASGATGGGATTTTGAGAGGDDGGFDVGQVDGGGGEGAGTQLIYAHTDTTLFQLDPSSPNLALTPIGDFDCIGGAGQDTAMTDFAVDGKLTLWGISANAVHPLSIQGTTVHCGAPVALNNPKGVRFYGLSFAPAGVLDPTAEVLVGGNTAGELWAIDGNGNLAQHGTFGAVPASDGNGHSYANAGKAWELSGDIVFLANNGSPVGFATVRDCPNPPSTTSCNPVNTLIELDVAKLAAATTGSVTKAVRGQIVKGPSCSDGTFGVYGNMYGIAAWSSKVYGFARTGNLVEIDVADGSACLVQAYAGDKFAGAGVTTLAPITPPPPK